MANRLGGPTYPPMPDLASRICEPCRGGMPPMTADGIAVLAPEVPQWEVVEDHHLRRELRFRDFATALDFVNRVGEMAEEQGHHPDMLLSWGRVEVTVWTHKIDGLAEADFVFAAKVDRIAGDAPGRVALA